MCLKDWPTPTRNGSMRKERLGNASPSSTHRWWMTGQASITFPRITGSVDIGDRPEERLFWTRQSDWATWEGRFIVDGREDKGGKENPIRKRPRGQPLSPGDSPGTDTERQKPSGLYKISGIV